MLFFIGKINLTMSYESADTEVSNKLNVVLTRIKDLSTIRFVLLTG